jgi:RimJ/RimL family protein N-acetyltransferase
VEIDVITSITTAGSDRRPATLAAMATATVRRVTIDDWDGWREVYESVAAEGRWIGGELPVDWAPRRGGFERMCDGVTSVGFVAEVDGRIVGQVGGELEPVGRAHLGMAIVDGYRSMRIGSGLLEALVDWARERGAHKVELTLWPWNDRARGLYERFGFVVEGHRRRHWRRNDGSLWDDMAMGLVLDEESPGMPSD